MSDHPTREVLRSPGVRPFVVARFGRATAGTLLMATLGWDVFDRTGSALALGLLGVVEFLPVVPVGLFGGALADASDRVRVTRRTQSAIAACALALAFTSWSGVPVAWLFALVFLSAVFESIEQPAASSILPSLVPPDRFPVAVVAVGTFRNVGWAVGPVLGGGLIALGGSALAYSTAAGLIAVAVIALGGLSAVDAERERGEVSWGAVREGISFVVHQRAILGSMTLDLFAVLFASVDALLPIFARDILDVGPLAYGFLFGAQTAGVLLMSLVQLRRPPGARQGRALLWAVGWFGLATLVFALSRSFALSFAALLVVGMADQVSMVARTTILQLSTPDRMRGRVGSVNSIFLGASNELGRAESGFLAAAVGAVASVVIGAGACLGALGVVGWRMPEVGRFRVPEAPLVQESGGTA